MKNKFANLSSISANKPTPLSDEADVIGGGDCSYTCDHSCTKSCTQSCLATGNVVAPTPGG